MGALSQIRRHLGTVAAAVLLSGFVVTGSFNFFAQKPVLPHENLSVKVLTPAILKGEPLRIRTSGIRNKLCVTFLARSYRDIATGVVLAKETAPGGFMGLGPWSEDIDLIVPTQLGVGEYQLRILQNNDCGEEVYPLFFPPVSFAIVSQR
jgi:hypothetical protein